jgi:hypothetical protein
MCTALARNCPVLFGWCGPRRVIENRREIFERYLQRAVQFPALLRCNLFLEFIGEATAWMCSRTVPSTLLLLLTFVRAGRGQGSQGCRRVNALILR